MSSKKVIILLSSLILLLTFGVFFYFEYIKPRIEKKELEEIFKEYYESKIQLFEEENKLYEPNQVDVVFIGDSLTDGCDLSLYYPNYLTLNRGIGGDTTFTLEDRLKVSLYDVKPKVVVMLIGGNNLKTMFDNYEDIVNNIRTNLPESKVVLVSLTAMGKTFKDKNEIVISNNKIILEIANKYNCYYVDVFTDLYNKETLEIYEAYTNDGAHLTHEGYLVLTSRINEFLNEIL